ncbi:TPA: glucose dehydrogenase [Pseudomonas putida]|jgi:quinoprotein glucose dehydrogenase|uniref:glucose dehydrogenase n=1 Tax=Pseudomonas TaxID=286 RepID=UPI0004812CFD|nr:MULTISPECIES: glucose dehydrogenase [Pseudomonas]MDD2152531.1 glucose dehydrogenase [Pseudomonas putida]RAS21446.1 quinoprotein glucose dehydrogenase [Pseudomonas sp. URMO17WK12:I7]SMF69013.1 quinoprotein glucose dehydrogenase [Pseudomonas sp. URMO17WK12:I5]HDS1679243.1 glucose dehydrogenase [Pseudomonas putida]
MNQRSSVSRSNDLAQPGCGGKWRLATVVLALALGAFGMALFGGGVWLMALGGSWYYGLTGAGCVVTAALLWRQRRGALHLFGVIWGLTVIWALWEVGLNWWGLVPRLVAMTVILLLILILSPALRRAPRTAA